MHFKLKILILLQVFISSKLVAQTINMNSSVDELIKLGKETLLVKAEAVIRKELPELDYNQNEYKRSAWSDGNNLIVKIERIFRYYPMRIVSEKLNHDLTIDLIHEKLLSVTPVDLIFIPNVKDNNNIEFVKTHFTIPSGFFIEVYETDSSFKINLENEVAFGKYEIDKFTGQPIMSPIEGSYAPIPDFPDIENTNPWFEIKK